MGALSQAGTGDGKEGSMTPKERFQQATAQWDSGDIALRLVEALMEYQSQNMRDVIYANAVIRIERENSESLAPAAEPTIPRQGGKAA